MTDKTSQQENTSPEEKIVPAKKIIYAEIDDEVTTIFDRAHETKMNDIYIVAPKQAMIFQSLVNLKILKKKIEDLGKKMSIITSDTNGIHLCGQIGVPVYNRVDMGGLPILSQWKNKDDKEIKISPLKASVNTMEDETPTRLSSKKVSIVDLIGRGSKRERPSMMPKGFNIFKRKSSHEDVVPVTDPVNRKLVLIAPNKQALVALISISVVVLLIIAYIALPGITIYITPKSSVLEQSSNVLLSDYEKNKGEVDSHQPRVLAMHQITLAVKKTNSFSATGKIFKGSNASGKLTIINNTTDTRPLIAKTRFQNADGVVFRIQSPVVVPKSDGVNPGKLEVPVFADEFDANGNVIGDRGNLGPTKFILPALMGSTQQQLYGESSTPMTGGKSDFSKKISKEDLKTAVKNMKTTLANTAADELVKAVNEKNSSLAEKMKFDLVNNKFAIDISEPRVSVDNTLEEKIQDQFDVYGEVDLKGYYFNKTEVLEILKAEIKTKQSPQKRIARIDEGSLSYRVFDIDKNTGHIKITATIKAAEEFDLDASQELGAQLVRKIKENITGKKISDAKDFVRNLPEVEKVETKSWPAWAPTVPSIPDNITVEIVR
ncbi:MAG: hypothetical protein UT33_C0008G0028 [Candidatus Peregrinibacteria bacterium GW2011_GWC2_39_14]|nr:MAG: hypothetical protein US92_C0004G0028 [Candidatus Peregrinibacteria bacterium GW2011_GWA2_38_36]KKR06712.1 MAG: hypothetical protein UT33_C0008G0028 [Candidatus Peregrinibacteria bacterium GW2011_GWC2_39_14]